MSWSELAAFYQPVSTERVVLVTLVEKHGSSYRQPGARLLVRADGEHRGGISAGCLEDEIARAATPVQRDGVPRLLTIDTRPHYGCPGQITVLLEALDPRAGQALFASITTALRARQPFTLVTDYRDLSTPGPRTRCLAEPESDPVNPPPRVLRQQVDRTPRLLLVGDGDDARTLAKIAVLAHWEVQAVAPEESQFAPERLRERCPPDERTAVVLLTHNLGHDVACLSTLLPAAYSYVGVIGSARRRGELVNGLETLGATDALAALEKLACPAGLDLGAGEAGEIAVSILAEIQCHWSGRDARRLRTRVQPIHPHDRSA